jgi:hypothetical protein
MSGHGEKLTRLAPRLVAGLLAGRTLDQLAADLGVARSTLERWLRNATFQKLYRQARQQAVERAVGRLSALSLCAVEALARHLDGGTPAVELKAAATLLGALKSLGGDDIEQRLQAIEERLDSVARPAPPAGREGE